MKQSGGAGRGRGLRWGVGTLALVLALGILGSRGWAASAPGAAATGQPAMEVAPSGGQAFEDVPPSNTFYPYVGSIFADGITTGYLCGGPVEPCIPPLNRPYFRPNNNVTRAQVAKMTVLAAGWTLVTPGTPTFTDVAPADWSYSYVETAFQYEVVGGYDCFGLTPGPTPPTTCREFRPNYPASRAQIAKMVYLAITPPPRSLPR